MTQQLMGLASGKVVVALEGGYNLQSISRSAEAVCRTLLGEAVPDPQAAEKTRAAIARAMAKAYTTPLQERAG